MRCFGGNDRVFGVGELLGRFDFDFSFRLI